MRRGFRTSRQLSATQSGISEALRVRNLRAFDAAKECLGTPGDLAMASARLCGLHVGPQAGSRVGQLGMPSEARPVGKSKRAEGRILCFRFSPKANERIAASSVMGVQEGPDARGRLWPVQDDKRQ